ncbi:MAG: tetratricopeptide repeat protein [Bacteroidales bacterium]|nr:tetratricopeptide repeat protein [Bacteroidales bacterium]
MKLRHSFIICVLFGFSFVGAQKFPFQETPIKTVDKHEKAFLTAFIFDQFSFGTVNYTISSYDFLKMGDIKNSFSSISKHIESFNDSLKFYKNLEDSINTYLKLFTLHKVLGNYAKADSISVVLSFRLNKELTSYNQGLSSDPHVLAMAAQWSEVCNNDISSAYYFYNQALAKDSLDSLAFLGLYLLYSRMSMYEKVDSMFFLGIKRFKKIDLFKYIPGLIISLYNTVNSLTTTLDQDRKLCLSQIIQIEMLTKLEKSNDIRYQLLGSLGKLLFYVMRYLPDLSSKEIKVKMSSCDKDSLQLLKSKLLKAEKSISESIFPFVIQESLSWLYLLLNMPDSSLFWLSKTEKNLEPFVVYFHGKMFNVKMLQTYIYLRAKKDTAKAVAILEDIKSKKEKIGFYPDNLLLLAKLYIALKQYDKALANIENYLQLPLSKTDALLLKAVALYFKKRTQESFAILDNLLKQEDALTSDKIYLLGAALYLLEGNTSTAYNYLLSGYAMQPQNESFLYLGSRYFKPQVN